MRARALVVAALAVACATPAHATPPWGRPAAVATPRPAAGARARASSPAAPSLASSVPTAELPEHAPVAAGAEGPTLGATDLARLLGATKYWRATLRKLELRTASHRVQLTVDNPFALVDDRTIELPVPVRSSGGVLRVPVALVDSLPRDTSITRLIYDARRGLVLRVPPEGLVRSPRLVPTAAGLTIAFPTDGPEDAVVIGRARAHFRVRLRGLFVGALPESLPPGGLLRAARLLPASDGCAFELVVAPEAQGYRLTPSPRGDAVELALLRSDDAGAERFAPEGTGAAPMLRVVVLDPGHGGGDAGVTAQGAVEKTLTLELARALAREIEQHLAARAVLTRTDDRAVGVQQRAETANRARADVVLSLHFDGSPAPGARGVTVFCPPATYAAAAADGPQPIALLPWRDVATRHAVRSRALAEAIASQLVLRGLGPVRLREVLPEPLLGVNAPGLLIECATLTAATDRARVTSADGLDQLARALAAGLDAYRRPE